MARIGVRELRADLAAALRRAGAGEEMTVTVAGQPVARLTAVTDATDGRTPRPTVEALVAGGLLVPPRRTGHPRDPEPVTLYVAPRFDVALRDVR